ncbi:MAG: peptidoglycan DD-metalloendopeptidase family protein [Tannerella sp.]|jgi:septal ring factor EnvC (AmiA/AmiB activator)|nr:peptidoglycan DD-metalloendopeptidase family protein [Tannerella sp.]
MRELLLVILFFGAATLKGIAQIDSTAQQPQRNAVNVSDLEKQRDIMLKDIEMTTTLLKETDASAQNSLNRLNLLTQQLAARRNFIALLSGEIATLNKKIDAITKEISVLEDDLVKIKENYARSMQSQQHEHRTAQYKMLLILSAENLTQSYRRMRYLREYSDWQKIEAERIMNKQADIVNRKAELEKTLKDKQRLYAQREDEGKNLFNEEKQQKNIVGDIKKKQKMLLAQLRQKRAEAAALNNRIDAFVTEDIKTTDTELNLSNDFSENKGMLPYPLNGSYKVVSSFGEHQHQELANIRTNNNGIDIQTTAGVQAVTIFNGVVTRVFPLPGFNNNVIIRHGNYISVYSNLSKVFVKAGDKVAIRQPLGEIYTDAEKGNETILHFELRKERTKLNPQQWLR